MFSLTECFWSFSLFSLCHGYPVTYFIYGFRFQIKLKLQKVHKPNQTPTQPKDERILAHLHVGDAHQFEQLLTLVVMFGGHFDESLREALHILRVSRLLGCVQTLLGLLALFTTLGQLQQHSKSFINLQEICHSH